MGGHSCHTKAVLIDDRMSIVGSYNLDMRSTYQDTELMLAIDSEKLNSMIRKEAETDKTYSKTMGPDGNYIQGENYVPKNSVQERKSSTGLFGFLLYLSENSCNLSESAE